MTPSSGPPQNQLLACLPYAELERLTPLLDRVALPAGKCLYESGSLFQHVYFPISGLVALHSQIENGDSSVLSLVGREGFVGVSSFMGGLCATSNATVFSDGIFCACTVAICFAPSNNRFHFCTCCCATPKP